MRSLIPSKEEQREGRKEEILRDLERPQTVLRRGSLPKWINPKTDVEDDDPHEAFRAYLAKEKAEKEKEKQPPIEPDPDRPQVLRKERLWFQRTRSLADLHRPPSPSEDRTERRTAPNPNPPVRRGRPQSNELCTACRGINIETITTGEGYDHIMLGELRERKHTCRMCWLIHLEVGLKLRGHSLDRYRFRISLQDKDRNPHQWDRDHDTASQGSYDRDFSSVWVEAMDLRPWEPPEYYKTRNMYENGSLGDDFLKPLGSSPVPIRGRAISCFTDENDPARQLGVRWTRNIGENTASEESFDTAAGWLAQCRSSSGSTEKTRNMPHVSRAVGLFTRRDTDEDADADHPQAFEAERPTRLIKIDMANGEIMTHLIDTKDEDYEYVALSYCWGQQAPEEGRNWQLTEANHIPHHKSINLASIPPTCSDAVLIALKLGFSYIWIDALCIIQDSVSDWAREASKMGAIYRGSSLTIAISGSESAKLGAFNKRSQKALEMENFDALTTVESTLPDGRATRLYFLSINSEVPDMYDMEVSGGPLSKRGWTFQEHVLPQRTLYYTRKQLFWECTHCRLSEDNFPQIQQVRAYPITDFEYTLGSDDIASFWYSGAVQEYTRRKLSFAKDKLVAISALAKATYLNRQQDYIAGIWRDSMILGLQWIRKGEGCKSKTYDCPSWSWASQDSEVSYRVAGKYIEGLFNYQMRNNSEEEDQKEEESPESTIVEVDWKPDPTNPFGSVSSAYIDLHTKIGVGTVLRDHFQRSEPYEKEWEGAQALGISYEMGNGRAQSWCARATMDDSTFTGGRVAIAILREARSETQNLLLLHPPDPEATEFRRVGLAEWDQPGGSPFRGRDVSKVIELWTEKKIRLV